MFYPAHWKFWFAAAITFIRLLFYLAVRGPLGCDGHDISSEINCILYCSHYQLLGARHRLLLVSFQSLLHTLSLWWNSYRFGFYPQGDFQNLRESTKLASAWRHIKNHPPTLTERKPFYIWRHDRATTQSKYNNSRLSSSAKILPSTYAQNVIVQGKT